MASVNPLAIFNREFKDNCMVCENERRELVREIDREHHRLLHLRQNMRYSEQFIKNKKMRTINREMIKPVSRYFYNPVQRKGEVDELTVEPLNNDFY